MSSLDYRATLATVARFAVPTLADWCAVDIRRARRGRGRTQVAVAHVDPSKVRSRASSASATRPIPTRRRASPQVIRTGKSELYTEIPRALLEARRAGRRAPAHDPRACGSSPRWWCRCARAARTFGAMTFIYADSGRRYTQDDLAFAEDFARRAAMAIENALALKEAEDARPGSSALRSEAELANRAKDEFLATVSHELRTPLNAILGWTVMLRGRKPARGDRPRPWPSSSATRALQTKLIEDVLDVSRIISGKLALNLGPTNVARCDRGGHRDGHPGGRREGRRRSSLGRRRSTP